MGEVEESEPKSNPIISTESLRNAIHAADHGAVAIYQDDYPEKPLYHIVQTEDDLTEFERLLKNIDYAEGQSEVLEAQNELKKFVRSDLVSDNSYISVLFKEGKWSKNRRELDREARMHRTWEEIQDDEEGHV